MQRNLVFFFPSAAVDDEKVHGHTGQYSTFQAEEGEYDDYALSGDPIKPMNKKYQFDLSVLNHGIFKEEGIPDVWEMHWPVCPGWLLPSKY